MCANSKLLIIITTFMASALGLFTAKAANDKNSSTAETFTIETPVKMQVFLPAKDKATGRAVVDLPGGGYTHLALEHEGAQWAEFFNSRGIAYAVVTYKMPAGDYKIPVTDAENAMKVMRENAAKWNINPNDVGIMGFSAGGHLASTIATHSTGECRPDFQILFYPVVSMDPSVTHMGSHDELLGANATKAMEFEFSGEKQVTPETPRAFIVLSGDDSTVKPLNSVNYYVALLQAGVPATMHIYETGEHGWGLYTTFKYHDQMLFDLSEWLKSF